MSAPDDRSSPAPPLVPAALGNGDPIAQRTRRVAALALFTAVVLVVFLVARESALSSPLVTPRAPLPRRILLPLSILLSLGLFWLARRPDVRLRTLERVGLAYYVSIAAAIAVLVNEPAWPDEIVLPGWSPVAVWVLVYPFMVPTRLRLMAIGATAAALMDPLALVLLHSGGAAGLPRLGLVVYRFLPNVVAVVLAVIESRMLKGLDERLSQAREVGSYQLVEKLGRGGMGEVWLARHRMLARPAAVKLIRPDVIDDPEAARVLLKRFEREVQATAELRSPHTVQIYDYGIGRDGTFFYAMELLDGLDLHRLVLSHGPLPAARVVHLLRQACHSLHEAHLRGLVHRDIKPANIFACRYGADLDFVKLLDFGLVKRHAPDDDTATQLTVQGAVPGSPAFMAPEIATAAARIDGRADLYSLGCVAYWLLTGSVVFNAASPMRMMLAHAHQPPEPPSLRTHREVPPALEAVIMGCLEKRPEKRPQTAHELSQTLSALGLQPAWTEGKRVEWWAAHGPERAHDPLAQRALELFETERV